MKLTKDDITNISSIKEEPTWMLDLRMESYNYFIMKNYIKYGIM